MQKKTMNRINNESVLLEDEIQLEELLVVVEVVDFVSAAAVATEAVATVLLDEEGGDWFLDDSPLLNTNEESGVTFVDPIVLLANPTCLDSIL